MTVFAFIVLTEAQKDAVLAVNGTPGAFGVEINPRLIDNPMADELGYGTLTGAYICQAALRNEETYAPWHEPLAAGTIRLLDTDTVVLPSNV